MSILGGFMVPHPPLIVPEVGRGQQAAVQKTIDSYHAVAKRIAGLHPQTVILITPHSVMYADYIHLSPGKKASGSFAKFGAPAVFEVAYDDELVAAIGRLCDAEGFPAGTLGERDASLDHGAGVPLHFIQQYSTDCKLVRCSVSGLSRREHYRFGMLLAEAARMLGRETVIVASGDLSHKLTEDGPYGFAPEGPALDEQITRIMRTGDFGGFFTLDEALCEKGAECGLRSFLIMAGAFDQKAVSPHFYSYEGPMGVGYAVCAFTATGDDPTRDFLAQETKEAARRLQAVRDKEDAYVRLARQTLEAYVRTGKLPPAPGNLPEDMTHRRAGVFVSLHKDGQLRGCIGTTEPTCPSLWAEIRQNAVSAGTGDPRFDPVEAQELDALIYHVDVLSPASPCTKEELDAKRYGVIVTSGRKRGLLLPDLEGVDTVDAQIAIACRKAGIGEGEAYTLERFEVVRHT